MYVTIYQIGLEGKREVRKGIDGLSISDEMAGRFPFDLYKEVFHADVPYEVSDDPFYHFNRTGFGGFLERYEQQNGQVEMWSLSVGDVVAFWDGTVKRLASIGWEVISDDWNAHLEGLAEAKADNWDEGTEDF